MQRQHQAQYMSWSSISTVTSLRKQYVPAYLKCLQTGKVGGDDAIHGMDAQLDDQTILFFRKMAQAKFLAAKQKAQLAAGTGAAAAGAGGGGGASQQGWFGWMWGGGGGHKGHQQQSALPSAAGAAGDIDEQPTLGSDEWLTLEKALEEQEAALATEVKETPMTVKLRVKAVVEVAAVELQGADGTLLLQGSLSGVNTAFIAYPTTTDLYLDVAMVGRIAGGGGRWGGQVGQASEPWAGCN